MAIGYEDEFDYLEEEDDSKADEAFAPKIKGSTSPSLTPEEDVKERPAEEEVEEKKRKKKLRRSQRGNLNLKFIL